MATDYPFLADPISETLLIPLYMRAQQTLVTNPLIQDESAVKLVQTIDYDFSQFNNKPKSAVGTALRAAFFDQQCREFIIAHSQPIIVNVGCGLDDRYARLGALAQNALFYELDMPNVIDIRQQLLPTHHNQHLIACSMFDTPWLDKLASEHPNAHFLFVIEGVLMYFDEQHNRQFFSQVAERIQHAEFLFDMAGAFMAHNTQRHDVVSQMQATFKFGSDDEKVAERWHPRLEHLHTTLFHQLKGYHRMGWFIALMMRFVPKFKRVMLLQHYKLKRVT
ncbi:class I SAM-dependent methyltransferase [Pasteurellaceae bacterium HPA106]|uniref:class I SAM-dependent methyltransferase n=1 Tax=Spirabiliibacterium pneumoniae TaxID=221400 RepID=UPI001AAC9138|nr:class I SAM-dependent methyltransferase [Spirabiliibacterium pneumoniae]MBE2895768.1 class I SAM-dependent methyltransferase [Spirabiliibacterium pneumoniae]